MPLNTLTPTELLTNVATNYLAQSLLRPSPLIGMLSRNVVQQKQNAIEWGAKVGDPAVTGRTVTGALSNDNQGVIKGAALSLPPYYIKHQIEVIKRDLTVAVNTGKIYDVMNPVNRAVRDAIDIMARKIQSALYNGTGTEDNTSYGVIGLETAIGDGATGSYAGISRVTYPKWRSLVVTGTTPGTAEPLSVDKVSNFLIERQVRGATYQSTTGTDLVYVTNPYIYQNVLRKLYATAADEQALYEQYSKDILPYVKFFVHGVPVIPDVDCPANTIFALNLNELAIHQFDQSDADMPNGKISYFPFIYADENGASVESPLMVRMADVTDEHPDYYRIELTTQLQLAVYDLNKGVAKIDDVSHTAVAA